MITVGGDGYVNSQMLESTQRNVSRVYDDMISVGGDGYVNSQVLKSTQRNVSSGSTKADKIEG